MSVISNNFYPYTYWARKLLWTGWIYIWGVKIRF